MVKSRSFGILLFGTLLLNACSPQAVEREEPSVLRIASFHGTATELLFALGLGDQLVLRDVTSSFPADVAAVPVAGHVGQITVEAVLAAQPDVVICTTALPEPVRNSIAQSGVELLLVPSPDSPEFGVQLYQTLAAQFNTATDRLSEAYRCLSEPTLAGTSSAIFLYGSSATSGYLVSGSGTAVHEVIRLAGGINPTGHFDGFKPLTPEALLAADPEFVVMFDHSFEAAGGADGLLAIPGMRETRAGKQRNFLHFPGQAMNGFGPRTCAIIRELNQAFAR